MGVNIGPGITIEGGISITREVEIPENVVAPVVSGNTIVRSTLSTTNGTWVTIYTPTFSYQWQHNSANISSATSNTYVIPTTYVGENLQCVVTATNISGNGSATSNSVGPITANVPLAPTIGTATSIGSGSANITFTVPSSNGGSAITLYTATSNTGGLSGTGTSSPITVTGLTVGQAYTFTVTATNSIGTSSPSAASNAVVSMPAVGDYFRGGYFLYGDNTTYHVIGPQANTTGPSTGAIAINAYYLVTINGYSDWDTGLQAELANTYTYNTQLTAVSQGVMSTIYWTGVQVVPFTSNLQYTFDYSTGLPGSANNGNGLGPHPTYYARPYRRGTW